MKKQEPKSPKNERETSNEKIMETVRGLITSKGWADLTLTDHKDANDKQGTITHYFTSQMPKLVIKSGKIERILDVEMSSVEVENQSLLHFLFNKSKD